MNYVVTARDYKDGDTINRRLINRDNHLSGLRKLAEAGNFLSGGAILNAEGKMVGSTAHVSFETEADLRGWIDNDPYMIGKVWEEIEIKEIALFPV